jgi:hypothetical protein
VPELLVEGIAGDGGRGAVVLSMTSSFVSCRRSIRLNPPSITEALSPPLMFSGYSVVTGGNDVYVVSWEAVRLEPATAELSLVPCNEPKVLGMVLRDPKPDVAGRTPW